MKTRFLKVLSIVFLSLSAISCGALIKSIERGSQPHSAPLVVGDSQRINGVVYQTINSHQALVELNSSSYDRLLVYVVTPSSCKEYFFDKLAIRGVFIFLGTHQYQTVNREYDQFKTVPVFVEKRYYIQGMEWDDRLERIEMPETSEI